MSLTVSRGEGTMVITVSSNPNSKWPVLCQILCSLCHGPVCFVPEDMKQKLADTQRVFGIIQILIAVLNIMLGCFGVVFFYVVSSANSSMMAFGDLHVKVMVLSVLQLCVAIGFCVMTVKSFYKRDGSAKDKASESRSGICQFIYPFVNSCKMAFPVTQDMKEKLTDTHTALGTVQIIVGVMNLTSGCFGFTFSFWIGSVFLIVGIMCALAVKFPSRRLLIILLPLNAVSAALAMTAVGLYLMDMPMGNSSVCYEGYYHSSDLPQDQSDFKTCLYYRDLNQMIVGGLDIMMIVLSVLQLCVTVSFCVLTGNALCETTEDIKFVEDHEPLLELHEEMNTYYFKKVSLCL